MSGWRDIVIVALASLLLANCAATPVVPPPARPPPEAAPPDEPIVKPPIPVKPPAPPLPAKLSHGVSVPKLAKSTYEPTEMVGLDSGGVRELLGDPAQSRTEGAAHVLTYRAARCSLDVLMFPDVKAGTERVMSYQFDGDAGCYGDLRKSP